MNSHFGPKALRFSQLEAGDLFLMRMSDVRSFAIVAHDPADQKNTSLLLGPLIPPRFTVCSILDYPNQTVVSFSKQFVLRLSQDPSHWEHNEPNEDIPTVLLSGDNKYIRANFTPFSSYFSSCYVNIEDGVIFHEGKHPNIRYSKPAEAGLYCTNWAILTDEYDPRVLVEFPSTSKPNPRA